jgi:hypothetical protein
MDESLRNQSHARYSMSHDQAELMVALQSPDAYPHATEDIRVIETHISWVVLTGTFAYKIKKSVQLPFVDFSTLELRRHFCEGEISLNRRLAPEIYLDVVTIGRTGSRIGIGATPAIEYAVRMHQFGADATADQLIARDELGPEPLSRLAGRIARFHSGLGAEAVDDPGAGVVANLGELESLLRGDAGQVLSGIAGNLRAETTALMDLRRRRRDQGCIRECHGDLHLGNVAWIEPELVPFDCLEFDRTLRTIDVIDEVAFLVMDLSAHGRPDLAQQFLNSYLEATGDYGGLPLLRLYAAHRALVRAKVALIAQSGVDDAKDNKAQAYFDQARSELSRSRSLLIITFGLSGSGKSTVSRQLAPLLGAIHVRSDVERKRLQQRAAGARTDNGINQGLYSSAATAATYERLLSIADCALQGRRTIIVDASFLSAANRSEFAKLAARRGAAFLILHCQAPTTCLQTRVRQRKREDKDPSDADTAVLEYQLRTAAALTTEEMAAEIRANTESDLDIRRLADEISRRAQVSLSSTSY